MSTAAASILSAIISAVVALIVAYGLHKRDLGSFVRTNRKEAITATWEALLEVRFTADALWLDASSPNLAAFITAVRKADMAIQKGAILLEPETVSRLRCALKNVASYERGKSSLIDYRSSPLLSDSQKESICQDVIQQNGEAFNSFRNLLAQLEADFRVRITK